MALVKMQEKPEVSECVSAVCPLNGHDDFRDTPWEKEFFPGDARGSMDDVSPEPAGVCSTYFVPPKNIQHG